MVRDKPVYVTACPVCGSEEAVHMCSEKKHEHTWIENKFRGREYRYCTGCYERELWVMKRDIPWPFG